jgi:imidazole glycerol phosphate synthase subunit HisF
VRSVALAHVAAVASRVSIPVIGMGGVQSSRHARELLDVGATLVAVGTENFRDPRAAEAIAAGLISAGVWTSEAINEPPNGAAATAFGIKIPANELETGRISEPSRPSS